MSEVAEETVVETEAEVVVETGAEVVETAAVETPEVVAEDEVVVTIGDAAPAEEEDRAAPEWVRELRKTNRELSRENRELKKAKETTAVVVALGDKPTMADKDIDYDAAKFEDALNKWNDRKRTADNEAAQKQAAEKKAQDAWNVRVTEYKDAKDALKVKDFTDAEATAFEGLSQVQQGIIISGSSNPALVVYALGKNPAKLKELAAITDPVKFSFAVANTERDLKVTPRKAPPPEKVVTGSGSKAGITDSTLERLRADAAKTGDYSKVVAHKKLKRSA